MVKHWILVGDGSGARVYETDALLENLKHVEDLAFSHAHVHRDEGGHLSNAHLPGAGRDAGQGEYDPHKVTEERFARAIAKDINDAELRHRFERLVVVAPPRFLGDIRASLSTGATRRVVASFHHDWTRLSLQDLSANLKKNMPDTAGLK